jgi:hypothetical protein
VNDWTAPKVIPTLFWTIAHAWYVVPGDSPVMACEYATAELPDPSDEPPAAGALVPKVSSQVPGWVAE